MSFVNSRKRAPGHIPLVCCVGQGPHTHGALACCVPAPAVPSLGAPGCPAAQRRWLVLWQRCRGASSTPGVLSCPGAASLY